MTNRKKDNKIDFRPLTLEDKPRYERLLAESGERGCEYSFANLYLWGRQGVSLRDGAALIFSQFNRRSVYPYPLGNGEIMASLDAIIADARERGIACRISGITDTAKATLESLYTDRFRYHSDEDSYDYVYSVDDLSDLPGKKYDAKRNHIYRFREAFPDSSLEPVTADNLSEVEDFVSEWYKKRLADNPDADFHMERAAISKALRDGEALGLVSIILRGGGRILAVTMASRLSEDTMDVHFEKARTDVQGAYAAINCALARHVREKYPEIKYLNREEDMGIEGLRKAKRSYHPHHMVKKWWACLLEEEYEY